MSSEVSIGFVGAGKMASALAKGFVQGGITSAGKLIASDPMQAARSEFEKLGGRSTAENNQVFAASQITIIAVQPAQVTRVLRQASTHIRAHHLIVSIAAGITLAKLEADLPENARVIRVMPNTPALVGASASAYALGASATPQDAATVDRLLLAV